MMRTGLFVILFSALSSMIQASAADESIKDSLGFFRMDSDTPASILQGRVSGVRVSASDGGLNSVVNTYVRGVTSLHTSSEPLWIVDGVCLTPSLSHNEDVFWQESYKGKSYTQALNPLSFINPGDIESIEVLKDVTATALYGSRGANGVIIIKTKDAAERAQVDVNIGTHLPYTGSGTGASLTHNYNVSTSGEKNRNQYRISAAFESEDGVVPGESALGGGLNIKFDSKASKAIWFGLSSILNVGKSDSQYGAAYYGMPSATAAMRQGEGFQGYFQDYDDETINYRTVDGIYLQFNLLRNLTWRTELGVDYMNSTRYIWYGKQTAFGQEVNGAAAISNSSILRYQASSRFDYNVYLGVSHHLNPTVGVEYYGAISKYNTLNGSDFFSHILRARGLRFNAAKPILRRFDYSEGDLGLFGKISYDYDRIVGTQLICRADNNGRYDDSRFIIYPAASAYLDLHRLLFPQFRAVSALSINGGWGMSGRDRALPYQLAQGLYEGFEIEGLQEGTESLYEIRSQQICTEWHVGLQAAFLSDRLRLSVKYYDRSIDDTRTSFCFGYNNGATIRWRKGDRVKVEDFTEQITAGGVELDISGAVIRRKQLNVDLNANIACQESSIQHNYMGVGFNPFPELFGGLGAVLTTGRIGAQIQFDGACRHSLLNLNRMYADNANDPSEYLEKADFLRLGLVGVSYRFPIGLKWLSDITLKLTAQNLFVATGYSGYSPDVDCYSRYASRHGVDYGSFPMHRTVMFGLNIKF